MKKLLGGILLTTNLATSISTVQAEDAKVAQVSVLSGQ